MQNLTQVVDTFPSVIIPNNADGLPIEVSVIGQLGHGAGNQLFSKVVARQQGHKNFIDQHDEPSAKLGSTNLPLNDPSALYSFAVGSKGHPFHCHAGNRFFTAVSGSGGTQLRFSVARLKEIVKDPKLFIQSMHFINIPADCMFTVRFGGGTWHQFLPLTRNGVHPAFFALSYHANELGGDLSDNQKEKVLTNEASIPALTELLPDTVNDLLDSKLFQAEQIPTTTLALDAPSGTFHRVVCDNVRGPIGRLRGFFGTWERASGFVTQTNQRSKIKELNYTPKESLLSKHLADETIHHDDSFIYSLHGSGYNGHSATHLLQSALEGFLLNPPQGVSWLMSFRNTLVKPLGLRTSRLGCPVSSLLLKNQQNLFANRYPVLDQHIDSKDRIAQVVLGADDKHLKFRSCISVHIIDDETLEIRLGSRVHCKNLFGRFYMSAINNVHRNYVSPTMLRKAVDYVISQEGLSLNLKQ